MTDLTYERLRAVLRYDPETGDFIWLAGPKVGQVAGTTQITRTGHRYRLIKIDRVSHKAHRLARFYMVGSWPPAMVDHKDGDGLNNRWENLRDAVRSQNHQNQKLSIRNTSGFKGVFRDRKSGRWLAGIKLHQKKIALGTFDTPTEAAAAYASAARKLFGEFARLA